MHHKVRGIVIKEKAQGESSKLLTVLTELDGVITVKAKGARSISASNLKSVQLFACSNMLLYIKNGFYTLVDAELIDDFYTVREQIEHFALASYCCEVAGSVAIKDSGNSEVLQLLLNTLYVLTKGLAPVKLAKAVFEFRLACVLGFEPDTEYCGGCEKRAENRKMSYFDPENGVFFCSECELASDSEKSLYPVSQTLFDSFKYIQNAKSGRIFSFSVDRAALEEMETLSEIYLHIRLEKNYKSLDFLKTVL
jgi:DNA repair protein RecO (recombination protein O)